MDNLDFSMYRLKSENELIAYHTKMGQHFWQYANRLFRKVLLMKPGESFRVNDLVKEENRDLFIKLLCWFIISGLAPECLFNEKFNAFKRRDMQYFEPHIVNNCTKRIKNNDNK